MAEKIFHARYDSPCKVCGRNVKGSLATWIRTKDEAKKGYVHLEPCWQTMQGTTPATTVLDPIEPYPVTVEPVSEPAPVPTNGHGKNGMASDSNAVMDLLSRAIWERIEDRVKQVESSNDELAQQLDAELSSFRVELTELVKANSVPQLIRLEVTRPEMPALTIENAHRQLALLINLMNRTRNNSVTKWPYLWDATGGGKSYAVPQAAEALGLRYAAQSFNSQSPDYLITGYNDANGNYVPSLFYDLFKNGGVYAGEEVDDGSADLLVTLNVALANGHMTFPNREVVKRNSDFIFVGLGNTAGRGPTPRYPERKPFDAAFANRFFFIRWEYDLALERQIALSINPDADKYVSWVQTARDAINTLALRLELTPRTSFVLAELSLDDMYSDETLLDGVTAGIDATAKAKLLENCPFPTRS
jgi:hypothetical protein